MISLILFFVHYLLDTAAPAGFLDGEGGGGGGGGGGGVCVCVWGGGGVARLIMGPTGAKRFNQRRIAAESISWGVWVGLVG